MPKDNLIANLEKNGFEYISKLGSGGFGNVVKVKHKISKQFFAVKTLNNSRINNPENILREIQAIARINNSNIISYKHSFIEDGELYLVMEYCSNGSLRDWINKVGKIEIEPAVNIFLRLTHTFNILHTKGYIHHDIKPDNILFSDEKLKIIDFGTVNTNIGTIRYSAPEMLMSDPPVNDVRVDIFSLGITFMECVTGINPLSGKKTWDEIILTVKNADFPIKRLPYWLQQVLLKACHYNPSARFQTMLEFYDAIRKRHIPQIIDKKIIESNKLAVKLKMIVIAKRWRKAKEFIDSHDNESMAFLIQKGKYFLGTNQLEKAKITFEDVLKKDRNAPIEKNMGEIYFRFNEPSRAATILHGYVNHHFNNIEAHNQLLHSYYLSDQWELGLNQAAYLRKIFPKELIFINNHCLFQLLLGKEPNEKSFFTEKNSIGFYNYHEVVLGNSPESYDSTDFNKLKSKLLFHEFNFRNIDKSKNTVSVEINGVIHNENRHIISFGRKFYDYNTFSNFEDNSVSRRHFVIINQKNNVWLHDLSTLGTYIDEKKVQGKEFLLGRSSVKFGNQEIFINPDSSKLL